MLFRTLPDRPPGYEPLGERFYVGTVYRHDQDSFASDAISAAAVMTPHTESNVKMARHPDDRGVMVVP